MQIQRLKGHLTGQQRGNSKGVVGASITITPGITGAGGMTASMRDDAPDVDDPEYCLKQETTEFLTQLSQSLSDENDNLIGLVRTAITTLKELQGTPEDHRASEDLSMIREEDEDTQQGMLRELPTSYETLASTLESCLDNLKHLLTNPDFVSLEEVETRDEEILRLRAGWEKMETRLREAFALMEAWRRRVASGGDTINLDELKMGLGLGLDFETVNGPESSMLAGDEDDEEEEELDGEEEASSVFDEEPQEPEEPEALPSPEDAHVPEKTTSDVFSIKLQPNPPALKETSGNAKSPSKSPRKVAFSASIPNTPSQLDDENNEASNIDLVSVEKPKRPTPRSAERSPRPTSQGERTSHQVRTCDLIADKICKLASKVDSSSSSSLDSFTFPYFSYEHSANEDPNEDEQAKKRPSPHAHPDEPSPKLTVQDKLKVAQAEAEAAAVTARSSPAKKDKQDAAVVEKRPRRNSRASPMKTRVGGRPRRRKSTLTPEELDNLLGV